MKSLTVLVLWVGMEQTVVSVLWVGVALTVPVMLMVGLSLAVLVVSNQVLVVLSVDGSSFHDPGIKTLSLPE